MMTKHLHDTLVVQAPGAVKGVGFSPDGRYLAYGCAEKVSVLDCEGYQQVRLFAHESPITCLAWSPVRNLIAAASARGKIQVWDTTSSKRLAAYQGPAVPAHGVAWSPDGKYLASGGHSWQVWDAVSGELRRYNQQASYIHGLAWSPDGTRLATCDGGTLLVWSLDSMQPTMCIRGTYVNHLTGVAWSPDGTRLATSGWDRFAHVWEADTGKKLLTYGGHSSPVQTVAWASDGNKIATSSGDGFWPRPADTSVQVWDASIGRTLFLFRANQETVQALAWSPDGTRLASGSKDGRLHLWSPQAGA